MHRSELPHQQLLSLLLRAGLSRAGLIRLQHVGLALTTVEPAAPSSSWTDSRPSAEVPGGGAVPVRAQSSRARSTSLVFSIWTPNFSAFLASALRLASNSLRLFSVTCPTDGPCMRMLSGGMSSSWLAGRGGPSKRCFHCSRVSLPKLGSLGSLKICSTIASRLTNTGYSSAGS